jgi:hypothetical protein
MPTKVNIKPSESVHTQYMGPTNTRGARIQVAAALLKSKNLACTDDRKRGYLWSKR